MDNGAVWVLEKGVMYAPPGRLRNVGQTESKKQKLSSVCCSVRTSDNSFQPAALRAICVAFVAQNVELADSLEGFPDLIGKEIFSGAEAAGKFRQCDELCAHLLSVFTEAYEADILSELGCFREKHARLERCLPCVLTFRHLGKLDLHGCFLGDDHDLLAWIGRSDTLTHLGLGMNCLSCRGLRQMTSYMRMYKGRGPTRLTVLDLSCNERLDASCARFLKAFPQLSELNLSGCRIQISDASAVEEMLGLALTSEPLACFTVLSNTVGWASVIVRSWSTAIESPKLPARSSQSKAGKFYSTERKRIAKAKRSIDIPTVKHKLSITLHFSKPGPLDTRRCSPQVRPGEGARKSRDSRLQPDDVLAAVLDCEGDDVGTRVERTMTESSTTPLHSSILNSELFRGYL